MNDQTAAPVEGTTKTVIRPNLQRYVRAKSGNGKRTHRTDDFVARTLDGKTLDEIKQGANLLGIDAGKWEHLNPGQQRMLIGNGLRNRLADKKAPLTEQEITDVYGEPCEPYDADAAADAAANSDEEEVSTEEKPAKGKKRKAA